MCPVDRYFRIWCTPFGPNRACKLSCRDASCADLHRDRSSTLTNQGPMLSVATELRTTWKILSSVPGARSRGTVPCRQLDAAADTNSCPGREVQVVLAVIFALGFTALFPAMRYLVRGAGNRFTQLKPASEISQFSSSRFSASSSRRLQNFH